MAHENRFEESLIKIFIAETREHLSTTHEALFKLKQDTNNSKLVHAIFVQAHAIKGTSAMLGFSKISSIAKNIEDIFQAIKEDKIKINNRLLNLIQTAFDSIELILLAFEKGVSCDLNIKDLQKKLSNKCLKKASKTTPPKAEKAQILIVEDSLIIQELEKRTLEAKGYRVKIASDGIEALTIIKENNFDLILTDIQMPKMNGFELISLIKKDNNLRKIPVIVITSNTNKASKNRATKAGVNTYIVKKDLNKEVLLKAIKKCLKQAA